MPPQFALHRAEPSGSQLEKFNFWANTVNNQEEQNLTRKQNPLENMSVMKASASICCLAAWLTWFHSVHLFVFCLVHQEMVSLCVFLFLLVPLLKLVVALAAVSTVASVIMEQFWHACELACLGDKCWKNIQGESCWWQLGCDSHDNSDHVFDMCCII